VKHEVLLIVREEMSIVNAIERRKVNLLGYLAWELPSTTCYRRKGTGKDRSDRMTRKKT
jgi:hypothetical protein